MDEYNKQLKQLSQLQTAYYGLEEDERIILITKLWDVCEAAEEALFDYFSQRLDDGELKGAATKKGATLELKRLIELLKNEEV